MQTPWWDEGNTPKNFDNTWNRHHRAAGHFLWYFFKCFIRHRERKKEKTDMKEAANFFLPVFCQQKKRRKTQQQFTKSEWFFFQRLFGAHFFFLLSLFVAFAHFILLLRLNGCVSITAYACMCRSADLWNNCDCLRCRRNRVKDRNTDYIRANHKFDENKNDKKWRKKNRRQL